MQNPKDLLLSKKNISNLYKKTLDKSGLNSEMTPKEQKTLVVKVLTSKMKEIYKSIDFSRVNKDNFEKIYSQYNTMCLDQTSEFIKGSDLFLGEDNQVSRVKFNRDFNSLPEKQVKFLERPKNESVNQKLSFPNDNRNPMDLDSNYSNLIENQPVRNIEGFNSQGGSSELQGFFTLQNESLENYPQQDSGQNIGSSTRGPMPKKYEDMQKMRQLESQSMNKRPPTPEFLKSVETQERKDVFDTPMDSSNMNRNPTDYNSNMDINRNQNLGNNIESSQPNNDDLGTYGGDQAFFPIDNMDAPLVNTEIVEDNSSFEDRLKKLQSERIDIKPESMNSMGSRNEPNLDSINKDDFGNYGSSQNEFVSRSNSQNDFNFRESEGMPSRKSSESLDSSNLIQEIKSSLREEMNALHDQQINMIARKTNEASRNITDYDSIQKEMITNQSSQTSFLQQENKTLQEKVNSLQNELNQLNEVKRTIATKFDELKSKNEIIQTNLNILNQRELEINNREVDIQSIINNYKFLLNSRFYQMNITSKENESSYSYYFDLKNVISIKLVSYSLPLPRFNIDNNNSKFKWKIDYREHSFELNKGFYTIDSLLNILSLNTNLKFELNFNQKIRITSNSGEFTIVPTLLSTRVLGIESTESHLESKPLVTNEADPSEISFVVDASKSWDLRLHDKLYLYLKNINDDPISILYFNGKGESHINLEQAKNFDKFDIEIRDENDNLYDFDNLPHSINLQFEVTNQLFSFDINENKKMIRNDNDSPKNSEVNSLEFDSDSKAIESVNQRSLRIDGLDIIIN